MMKLLSDKLAVKQRIILFIFSILITVISFVNFLYIPQREQIAKLTSIEAETQDSLNMVEDFMNKHPDIGVYEQEVQTKLNFTEKKMPATIELSTFIEQAETAASVSQVTLTLMKPEKQFIEDNYTAIPILVEFNGSYFQTLDFLEKLEKLDRFNTISNMLIQSKNGMLDCKLALVIYSYGLQQDSKKQENIVSTSNSY